MQILAFTPATLELLVYSSGNLADLDDDPTIVVTDANGATVDDVGTVARTAVGTYRATLPGQDLTILEAVWSGELSGNPVTFTRRYEIVGNLLFLESEARAKTITGQQTPVADGTAYPDSEIARIRALITDQFERKTERVWIRRYARCVLQGPGRSVIHLREGRFRTADGNQAGGPGRLLDISRIISASVGGTAVDLADLVLDGPSIHHINGGWTGWSSLDPFNVVIEYEYGPDPVPLEANENGLRMAIANLVRSDVSGFAQSFATPDGTVTFDTARLTYPTRVWEWLKGNDHHVPLT